MCRQHASILAGLIFCSICIQVAIVRTCLWIAAVACGVLVTLRIWLNVTLPKQAKVHAMRAYTSLYYYNMLQLHKA
jgi:uncharacterized protein YqfA (UPF0365 family)